MTKDNYIIIPHFILFNSDLSGKAKLLYGLLNSLCHKDGICFATNSYLADKLNCGKKYVSQLIKELEKSNLISIKYIYADGKKSIEKRLIKFVDTCPNILGEGIPQKWEDKRINIKDNIVEQNSTLYNAVIDEVIFYLNSKTDKAFKTTSQATQRLISARLNDGYTLDDFKKVINTKCEQWSADKAMAKYLRPQTLFGAKFESYLNENSDSKSLADEFKGYTKF